MLFEAALSGFFQDILARVAEGFDGANEVGGSMNIGPSSSIDAMCVLPSPLTTSMRNESIFRLRSHLFVYDESWEFELAGVRLHSFSVSCVPDESGVTLSVRGFDMFVLRAVMTIDVIAKENVGLIA